MAKGQTHPKLTSFCDVAQEITRRHSSNDCMTRHQIAEALGEILQDSVRHHMEEYRGTQIDESPLAEIVARKLCTVHETGWVRGKDFAQDMENIFTAMDQPTVDGVNTYFVSKAVAESGLKVTLSELGGDEMLGGYPSFQHIPKIMKIAAPFYAIGRLFRSISEPVLRRFTSPKYAGVFEYGGSMGGAYLLR